MQNAYIFRFLVKDGETMSTIYDFRILELNDKLNDIAEHYKVLGNSKIHLPSMFTVLCLIGQGPIFAEKINPVDDKIY